MRIEHDYKNEAIINAVDDAMSRIGVEYLDAVSFHDLDEIVLGDSFEKHFDDALTSNIYIATFCALQKISIQQSLNHAI